jgi:hypothetical protein
VHAAGDRPPRLAPPRRLLVRVSSPVGGKTPTGRNEKRKKKRKIKRKKGRKEKENPRSRGGRREEEEGGERVRREAPRPVVRRGWIFPSHPMAARRFSAHPLRFRGISTFSGCGASRRGAG